MKRVGLILVGAMVWALSAPLLAVPASVTGPTRAYALAIPIGCPGGPDGPITPTLNYDCPDGGKVVKGVYEPPVPVPADPLAKAGGVVCIAIPVIGTAAGAPATAECPNGEVPNDAAAGGSIIFYLKMVLILINGLIGGIIILVIVIAGTQYITSAGDPSRIKGAKKRLTQAFTALFLYLMMYAILNFLVPGGIL